MGKVTGSANSGRSELSNNFVIYKMLLPNTIALGAACNTRCIWITWSQWCVPGGNAGGGKRHEQTAGESSRAPDRLSQSTFLSRASSSPLLPAAPVQSSKPDGVSHFKHWEC